MESLQNSDYETPLKNPFLIFSVEDPEDQGLGQEPVNNGNRVEILI